MKILAMILVSFLGAQGQALAGPGSASVLVGSLSTEVVSNDSPKFRIYVLNLAKPLSIADGPGWDAEKNQKKIN